MVPPYSRAPIYCGPCLTARQPPEGIRAVFPLSPGASRHIPLSKRLLIALAVLGAGAGYHLWKRGAEPSPPPITRPVRPVPRSATIVLFQTDPPGAMVAIDGRPIGISPVTLESVAVGQHEVQARMEGRRDTTQTVMISAEGEREHAV